MNLWQLTEEQLSFIGMMEETGGEITPELEEQLQIRREEFQTKAENYTKFILKLESESEACASEIKRIQALKKTKDSLVERLKNNLLTALMAFGNQDDKGIYRYETAVSKLSTRKSQAVKIMDEEIIPDRFWAVKREVSKSTISEAIKNGEDVPGALFEVKHSISIR